MTLYCGIDLHANNSVIAILDDKDKAVFEKRLPNELDVILDALSPYQNKLCGSVIESTYNWYWLVDGLMDHGYEVQLANTAALRQYEGIKYTNDVTDARHLAHMLRLGILPVGHIYPKEERAVRDLLRRRLLLVHQRTMQHLSLQGLIARHTGKRLSTNQVRQLNAEAITELLTDPVASFAAETSWSLMQSLNQACARLEEKVLSHLKDRDDYALLTSIPGVGRILGMTIALETGNIHRFADVGNYASYARCVKSEKISNGKRKGSGNKKNGNKYLAWAFMEAAHFATIWEPKIKRYYQRKLAKCHIMVAKKAVANKLVRACYHMLKKQTPFEVSKAFG